MLCRRLRACHVHMLLHMLGAGAVCVRCRSCAGCLQARVWVGVLVSLGWYRLQAHVSAQVDFWWTSGCCRRDTSSDSLSGRPPA
ncbi:hypothetical protein F5X98DRAFT_357433 [Xylaria grammica]|nr:hypothetical protein F5X98DRAFT_357433 [Xylaria grammica]